MFVASVRARFVAKAGIGPHVVDTDSKRAVTSGWGNAGLAGRTKGDAPTRAPKERAGASGFPRSEARDIGRGHRADGDLGEGPSTGDDEDAALIRLVSGPGARWLAALAAVDPPRPSDLPIRAASRMGPLDHPGAHASRTPISRGHLLGHRRRSSARVPRAPRPDATKARSVRVLGPTPTPLYRVRPLLCKYICYSVILKTHQWSFPHRISWRGSPTGKNLGPLPHLADTSGR